MKDDVPVEDREQARIITTKASALITSILLELDDCYGAPHNIPGLMSRLEGYLYDLKTTLDIPHKDDSKS